jgi:hypothetical protein
VKERATTIPPTFDAGHLMDSIPWKRKGKLLLPMMKKGLVESDVKRTTVIDS